MKGKPTVLLFAGQGAQAVGMGRDLVSRYPLARERLREADDLLGFSLSKVMFEGPAEELTRTSRCQAALYVHGVICLEILRELAPDLNIAGAAGLSLGEFTAHAAAGTFDVPTGLDLVAKRGRFMEEATNETEGTMAALMGGSQEDVKRLAADCDIDVANYNAPGQIVVSGARQGVAQAIASAREYGIRVAKELDVAGAYHSRLMISAQKKLAAELEELELQEPGIPVVCNIDAMLVTTPEEIVSSLTRQVSGPVRWSDSMEKFIADGDTQFLEIGPGGVLSGLMKRIDKAGRTQIRPVYDCESIEAAAEALNGATAAV